jgi:hypothetical protein
MKRTIKPTPRQRRLAQAIIDNIKSDKPLTKGEVLRSVGYEKISNGPTRVIDSPGVKQAIRDLGLTEEFITNALVEDIKLKPQNRLGELRLGAEVLGMKEDEDKPQQKSGNTYNIFFSKEIQEGVKDLEERIKLKLINNVKEN